MYECAGCGHGVDLDAAFCLSCGRPDPAQRFLALPRRKERPLVAYDEPAKAKPNAFGFVGLAVIGLVLYWIFG